MACPIEKTMPEIPLGISLVEQDNGFILRRKLANGEITALNLTQEEFWGLREAIGLLSRRIIAQRQTAAPGIKPMIAYPIAHVRVLPDAMRATVLLTVADPSGQQMTLEFPPHVAKFIADQVPNVLSEMSAGTWH